MPRKRDRIRGHGSMHMNLSRRNCPLVTLVTRSPALKTMMSRFLAICLLLLAASRAQDDVGYEYLFEDSTETVEWQCWDAPQLPSWLNGSFIIPAVGQFSYNGYKFQGTLDGFGKLHRFQLADGQVCERARMMLTGFYNNSHEMKAVAPAMLFDETDPPRPPCNVSEPTHKKYPSCNVDAPNDNTFVNTIKLGDEYLTLTDNVTPDHVDPWNAQVVGMHSIA